MYLLIKNLFFKSPTNKVFIIPTANGLKLFAVNLLLLVFGLIYANNYLLFFNFLFFSLLVVTMFYTNSNLENFQLLNTEDVLVEEGLTLKSIFQKTKEDISREQMIFSFKLNDAFLNSEAINLDDRITRFELHFPNFKKGHYFINKVLVSSDYPLGLFRAFQLFSINLNLYVYPRQIPFLMDINNQSQTSGELLDLELKQYQRGDRPSQILWKKSTENNLIVKKESQTSKGAIYLRLEDFKNDELGKLVYLCLKNDHPVLLEYKQKVHSERNEILKVIAGHES